MHWASFMNSPDTIEIPTSQLIWEMLYQASKYDDTTLVI